MEISVIIPAHNSSPERLHSVLKALAGQTLTKEALELVVVDNASTRPAREWLDLKHFSHASIVEEPQPGLTHARLAGFVKASGKLLVLVDDDNCLAPDYLENALSIARSHPQLGTWSGCVELVFEAGATPPPAAWRGLLTERQCQTEIWSNDPSHHDSTPWGAGMCIRREVADLYQKTVASDPRRLQLDLQGKNLVYGGDTDIAYIGCLHGWGKGVFPQLKMQHLIPASRCQPDYLQRAAEGRGYSECLHMWLLEKRMPPLPPHWKSYLRSLRLPLDLKNIEKARLRGFRRAWNELNPG